MVHSNSCRDYARASTVSDTFVIQRVSLMLLQIQIQIEIQCGGYMERGWAGLGVAGL